MTLLEALTDWMRVQCNKHNLDPDGPDAYVVEQVNQMTQCELLEQISAALEEAGIDLSPKPAVGPTCTKCDGTGYAYEDGMPVEGSCRTCGGLGETK